MVMVSKFSNFPDELSENDELSGSDCKSHYSGEHFNNISRYFGTVKNLSFTVTVLDGHLPRKITL